MRMISHGILTHKMTEIMEIPLTYHLKKLAHHGTYKMCIGVIMNPSVTFKARIEVINIVHTTGNVHT